MVSAVLTRRPAMPKLPRPRLLFAAAAVLAAVPAVALLLPEPVRPTTALETAVTPALSGGQLTQRSSRTQPPAIKPDLFGAPEEPAPAPVPPPRRAGVTAAAPRAPEVVAPQTPAAAPPAWVYTGFASLNGHDMALLEHAASGEGRWVTVGETLPEGLEVAAIQRDSVRLKQGDRETALALNTDFALGLTPGKRRSPSASAGAPTEKAAIASDFLGEELIMSKAVKLPSLGVSFRQGISDAEAKRLQSDVFDGRITREEAARRGLTDTPRLTRLGVSLNSLNVRSYLLNNSVQDFDTNW
jgi:hypothetical protein